MVQKTVILFAATLWIVSMMAPAALVTDGLIIQLDADAIIGLNDGDPVSTWADSANSDTVDGAVTTYTGFSDPVYKPGILNGMPVVRFTRDTTTTSNSTVLSSSTWDFPDPAQGGTYLAVFTPAEGANFARVFHVGSTAAGHLLAADVADPASGGRFGVRYNNGFSLTTAADSPLQIGTFHIGIWQMPQGGGYDDGLYLALDDLDAISYETNQPTRSITFDATGNYLALGNGYSGAGSFFAGDYYGGDVAEVLIYNQQLTQEQLGETTQYLRDKYYKTRAWNNSPLLAKENVDPATTTSLSWNTAMDPADISQTNPDVVKHYVHLTNVLGDEGDPNFAAPSAQMYTVTELSNPSLTIALNYGKTYYWRVDESVDTFIAAGSGPNDPNTITGFASFFSTLPPAPQIVTAPEDVLRYPSGDPSYEGDAVFSCVFTTLDTTPTVEWYEAGDPNNPIDDADADITITTTADTPIAGQWTSTLTIANVEVADQGAYSCVVTDDNAEPDLSTASASADLGVRRLVAYWPLDGNYLDASGEGHDADPNIAPDPSQWTTDVPDSTEPTNPNSALNLEPQQLAAATTEPFAAAAYTDEITVSLWAKWAGSDAGGEFWQGLLCSNTPVNNWFLEVVDGTGVVSANAPGYNAFTTENSDIQAALVEGEWTHVALTATAGEVGTIYLNGAKVAESTLYSIAQNESLVILGASNAAGGTINNPFNGIIDDARIYNYALSHEEVVDLYYEVLETPVCLNPDDPSLALDTNDDCVIDLADFAELSLQWLLDGLCPGQACP